jgi:hypothetical protein
VPGVVGDIFEAMRPVMPVACEDVHGFVRQMNLDAVAVELDFEIHLSPDGTLSIAEAKAGSMKPGNGALTPIAAGSCCENATPHSSQQTDSNTGAWNRSGTQDSVPRLMSSSMEEKSMTAKKKTARGRKQDRSRMAGGQKHEVQYESKKTGRSASAVKKAVKKVGMARRVEKRIAR